MRNLCQCHACGGEADFLTGEWIKSFPTRTVVQVVCQNCGRHTKSCLTFREAEYLWDNNIVEENAK